MSSPITTHILDLDSGNPAAGVRVLLSRHESGRWQDLSEKTTDADGRVKDLMSGALTPGHYRLVFEVGTYFLARNKKTFYRAVPVEFHIDITDRHYHVPLLISPFGYSTYRGS